MIHMHKPSLLALAAAAALSLSFIAMRPASPAAVPRRAFVGTVTGWSVDASGSVALRLATQKGDGEATPLWFVTVASRTSTTQFEQLVLDAVLALTHRGGESMRVTVLSDNSDGQSGRTVEDAKTLTALRRTVE